jgi:hypothetical protein
MRIASVREFRDKATTFLRSTDPIVVMRRDQVAGIFFPEPGKSLPLDFKRELFTVLAAAFGDCLREGGVKEREVLADFKKWRREKRQPARRRR